MTATSTLVHSLSDELFEAWVPQAAECASTLDAETTETVLGWLNDPEKDRKVGWARLSSHLDRSDSPLMRAALAHPDEAVRVAAWKRAKLPADVVAQLLRSETSPHVLVEAVLRNDLPARVVLEVVGPGTEQVADALTRSAELEHYERLPLQLWEQLLPHLTHRRRDYGLRGITSVVTAWLPLAQLVLRSAGCSPALRIAAATCAGVTADEIEKMLADLSDELADSTARPGRLDAFVDHLVARPDLSVRAWRLLADLVRACEPSEAGERVARVVTRRMLCGRTVQQVAEMLEQVDSEEELMRFVPQLPDACWDGAEFWRLLTSHRHAGSQVYKYAMARADISHEAMLRNMRPSWNPWQDPHLAFDMLTELRTAATVRDRFRGVVRAGVRAQIVAGSVVPPPTMWAWVYSWGEDEDALARRVPIRVVASGQVGSSRVLAAATALLLPALSSPAGRSVLDDLDDEHMTVGEFVQLWEAATSPAPDAKVDTAPTGAASTV